MVSERVHNLDDRRGPRVLGAVQAVRRFSRATGPARAVLTVLATYADPDGSNARPTNATLVRDTGLSLSTVQRSLRSLEAAGEIVLVRRGSGRFASVYRISLSTGGDNSGDNREGCQGDTGPNREGCQGDTAGVSQGHGRGVRVTPNRTDTDRNREGVEFPDHCPRHRDVEDPPPCRSCAQTREANAARRETETREATAAARRRRLEADRLASEAARAAAAAPDSPARLAFRDSRAQLSRSGTVPPIRKELPSCPQPQTSNAPPPDATDS